MKTKEVRLYIDLYPAWQDSVNQAPYLNATNQPTDRPFSDNRRIEIRVNLPCFGGSAEAVASVDGEVKA